MPQSFDDHEMLIRLDTKLDALKESVAEVKESLSEVNQAVATKADVTAVDKLEQRIDKLEEAQEKDRQKLWMILGGLGMGQFVLTRLLK